MTEQEIRIRTICAVLTGRTSNPDFANIHISTILDEALQASDLLIDKLTERGTYCPPNHIHSHETRHHLFTPIEPHRHSEICRGISKFRRPMHIKIGFVSK